MQQSKILTTLSTPLTTTHDHTPTNIVLPGQPIHSDPDYLNGHGTYKHADTIYASLMGTVEITNKLIIVNPIKSKYQPQIGDIVVGRVVEIANRRWKVDIGGYCDSYLNLNSVYITEQRKKNQEDQFNMRGIMQEGDYVVAEVQTSNADKTYNLHTRNPKYGKLEPGVLIQASHKLIKKQKHHFLTFTPPNPPTTLNTTLTPPSTPSHPPIGIILGNNGNIWLSALNRNTKQTDKTQTDHNNSIKQGQPLDRHSMATISVLYNLIRILSWEGLEISEAVLRELFGVVVGRGIGYGEICGGGDGMGEGMGEGIGMGKDKVIREYLREMVESKILSRLGEMEKNVMRG